MEAGGRQNWLMGKGTGWANSHTQTLNLYSMDQTHVPLFGESKGGYSSGEHTVQDHTDKFAHLLVPLRPKGLIHKSVQIALEPLGAILR